jgi:hypothetical protein
MEPEPSGTLPDGQAKSHDAVRESLDRALDALREKIGKPVTDEERATRDRRREESRARATGVNDPSASLLPPGLQTPPTELSRRAAELLGSQNIRIDTFQPPQSSGELIAEHIRAGERAMAESRWFDAEERFTAALAIREGDPMAAAGRVNAQLGAGMILSAAINLRNAFRAYPELMAVRFNAKLLPGDKRLERLRVLLRERGSKADDVAADAGLLLAYLGHQTGDDADLRDGMGILDRLERTGVIDADPLHEALRGAWGAQETPAK